MTVDRDGSQFPVDPLTAGVLDALLREWRGARPQAAALLGSYARGDAGTFSDVDILFLLPPDGAEGERTSFLVEGYLATVNAVHPERMDRWFTEPAQAVNVVAALRDAVPLQDPEQLFAAVQDRARSFVWTAEMQAKADRYASGEMVGLSEEAHKGLEGLRRNDVGRMLNARFGLSWLLARAVRVQRGILGNSDNSFYEDVRQNIGIHSRWSRLLATAFGVENTTLTPPSLREEVVAGLALYMETARLLDGAIQPEDRSLIELTVARIEAEMTASTIPQRRIP